MPAESNPQSQIGNPQSQTSRAIGFVCHSRSPFPGDRNSSDSPDPGWQRQARACRWLWHWRVARTARPEIWLCFYANPHFQPQNHANWVCLSSRAPAASNPQSPISNPQSRASRPNWLRLSFLAPFPRRQDLPPRQIPNPQSRTPCAKRRKSSRSKPQAKNLPRAKSNGISASLTTVCHCLLPTQTNPYSFYTYPTQAAPAVKEKPTPFCHCEERSDAAISAPADSDRLNHEERGESSAVFGRSQARANSKS